MANILVMLPNNLGDVIMALPALEGLKKQRDGNRIVFFVEEGYEGGLINNPHCDRVVRFNRRRIHDLARSSDWKTSPSLLRESVEELRRERFDRVINLSQHPYVSFIAALLACPDTIGRRYLRSGNHSLADPWSRYLYAIPFARTYNGLHATDVYRAIAGVAHVPVEKPMTVSSGELREAGAFLSAQGFRPNERPLVVLQPGAAYPAKRWPPERFIALGKLLAAGGFGIVVTGAPAERELAGGVASSLGASCVSAAGALTFRETIALLPFARGCVTGDTAIMHAAAALGITVYALFGPTNPVETGPWGGGNMVFCGRCPDRPCFRLDCTDPRCMKSIVPEDVYAAITGGAVTKTHCDVYSTSLDDGGISRLDPLVEEGAPYFDPLGAAVTRRVPEPAYLPGIRFDSVAGESLRKETSDFCEAAGRMIEALREFLQTGDSGSIRRFESLRAAPAAMGGIGAFWTALLNLRLNGVPLTDPVAAVNESAGACAAVKSEIETAASILR